MFSPDSAAALFVRLPLILIICNLTPSLSRDLFKILSILLFFHKQSQLNANSCLVAFMKPTMQQPIVEY